MGIRYIFKISLTEHIILRSFYPNPANTAIHFEKKVADLSLFNLEGKVMLNIENSQHINISNLASGIYILKIENTFQKLIIE